MIAVAQPMYVAKIKRANEQVWNDVMCVSSYQAAPYIGECFYVYEERLQKGQRYFSLQRTAISEPIGWLHENSVMFASYKELPRDEQIYQFSGTGMGYTHPNGGRLDQLYPALHVFEGQLFMPLETVRIGNNRWHLGKIGDTSAWVQDVHLLKC